MHAASIAQAKPPVSTPPFCGNAPLPSRRSATLSKPFRSYRLLTMCSLLPMPINAPSAPSSSMFRVFRMETARSFALPVECTCLPPNFASLNSPGIRPSSAPSRRALRFADLSPSTNRRKRGFPRAARWHRRAPWGAFSTHIPDCTVRQKREGRSAGLWTDRHPRVSRILPCG